MGWLATWIMCVVLLVGTGFVVLQDKALLEEAKIAGEERLAHPDPDRRRKMVRAIGLTVAVYGSVAVAFTVGWRATGAAAGAICAVLVGLMWVLAGGVYAAKSAWVSRR